MKQIPSFNPYYNYSPLPWYKKKWGIAIIIIIIIIIVLSAGLVILTIKYTGNNLTPNNNLISQNITANLKAKTPQRQLAEKLDRPQFGNQDSPLVIVEFSDFQCPFCQRFYNEAYQEIKSQYIDTGKAKIVFRHYPLPFHQNAQKSAEAFECAYKQDKSFKYHDILFEKSQADGTGLAVANLKQYARDLGLNGPQFDACLDSGEMASVVKKDLEAGQKAAVDGTPTFYINGKAVVGAQPFSAFQTAIEEALK